MMFLENATHVNNDVVNGAKAKVGQGKYNNVVVKR